MTLCSIVLSRFMASGYWSRTSAKLFHVTVDGDDIAISDAWSMMSEEDTLKRIGGQVAVNSSRRTKAQDFMYILMHQGGEYTHHDPGTEVWVYNIAAPRSAA